MAVTDTGGRGAKRPVRLFRNMSAKVASLPMVFTAVVVFIGCTIWTVAHSFTKSRLLPKSPIEGKEFYAITVPEWLASDGALNFSYPVWTKAFTGLANYERLWGERRWLVSIENLAIYGLCSLVLSLTIGFILAALLDRKIRGENTIRTIILYPFALSFVVTGLAWQWILNPDLGLQNVVRNWGFDGFTFDPLNNPEIVIFGILIAGIWQGSGFVMVLLLAGMRGIDEDIWKASRVEGIPAWKTYIFIVIPMMRPVFVTALVIIASGIIKVYDLVVAQTSGGPGIASEVPAKYVIEKMFQAQNLGLGFAASTMMLLSVLVILIPWAFLEFGGKKNNG